MFNYLYLLGETLFTNVGYFVQIPFLKKIVFLISLYMNEFS